MTSEPSATAAPSFSELGLPAGLLQALAAVGYETPSPIQAETIPPLLAGRDVLGQAQTGTGKTAAFALPALANIDPAGKGPQVLVLAPTRELAIQVAEAFQKYAAHLPGFHVLPVYGGQGYGPQLAALRRGVHVVVGTPGRIIDHLERGSLDLSALRMLVLDEADEMLRMGFIEDVENVIRRTPETRQVALFSATMPAQVKRIAQTYLKDPVEVAIRATTTTAANIRQRYWAVSGMHKLDALTRILEAEPFDAMIVFSRTKIGTEELAQKLSARGLAAAAIHGDMDQRARERTIQQLKEGRIDVLVATDVAARGLDVDRISHVLNYDIPYDTESYVHRIGRTGRAGRAGDAILFVAPRERGMLRAIERATRQPITPMSLPSVDTVNERRVAKFMERITEALGDPQLAAYRALVERYEGEHDVPAVEIAAALARVLQGDTPLLLAPEPDRPAGFADAGARVGHPPDRAIREPRPVRSDRPAYGERTERPERTDRAERAPRPTRGMQPPRFDANAGETLVTGDATAPTPEAGSREPADVAMETFRIEVGHSHGVQPGNIVGAIANEADLESRFIGRIDIRDDFTLVDLPGGMPREILEVLKKARVAGRPMRMRRAEPHEIDAPKRRAGPRPGGPRPGGPRPPGARPGGPPKRRPPG